MSISVAYKGTLREPSLVPEFVRDLTAKAKAAGWPCKTMEELVAEGLVTCSGLEGVTVYPHRECEPLHFHFDGEGNFINHTYHSLLGDTKTANMIRAALGESIALTRELTRGSGKKARPRGRGQGSGEGLRVSIGIPGLPEAPGIAFFREGSRYNWTRTQCADPKVHVAVCAILRYVKQRYAPELEVKDDSGYFDEEDYAKLEAQLAYVDHIAALTSQAIEAATAGSVGPMTLDAFVDRINEELADAKNKLH